jgi:UbiD family decarboxylase
MVTGGKKMGCQMRTETHQWKIYQKYEKENKAMPIAIVIGHDPFYLLHGLMVRLDRCG